MRRGQTGRVAIVDSHPIQYHVPWIRGLAAACDLTVFYAHRPSAADQAAAGYGVDFEWDVDLESGYRSVTLRNVAAAPNVFEFAGCDTPELETRLRRGGYSAVIVTGWYLKSYLQAILACARDGIPVLVRGDSQLGTPRGPLKRALKALTYPALLRRFDAFLCVGQRNREYLLHYGAPPEAIFEAPHFVDNAFFRERAGLSPEHRASVRREWGAGDDDRVALFVGRFAAFKRPGDLLESLAARSDRDRWQAVFVGAGGLGDALRERAGALGVRASFPGFKNQSELPAVYAAADVLVLPSDEHETWGLVVNEAMACGTPAVVSAAVGCAPDLITPGDTGEVFECGDVDALAAALGRITEPAGRARREGALRERVDAYSCERAVEGTLAALDYVHTGRPR